MTDQARERERQDVVRKRRSDAQEKAVSKAGKASGARRKAAAKRKRDIELREGWERARRNRG